VELNSTLCSRVREEYKSVRTLPVDRSPLLSFSFIIVFQLLIMVNLDGVIGLVIFSCISKKAIGSSQ